MSNHRHAADRRDFLKAAGTTAAALSLGPTILASDKAGSKKPILGKGEHTYEVTHNWGELPSGLSWGDTHGITFDENGFYYIKHLTRSKEPMDSIVVFDGDGKYVRSFGKEFHRGGHGIDIRKEGSEEFLYLCDVAHREVAKVTTKGEQVWKKSFPEEAGVYQKVQQFRPTNVAFAPDGGFYVADGYGSNYIHQYDQDAKWVRTFGGTGSEAGKMKTPHGLWLDDRPGRDPSLVVADRANARLQYFTLDGEHLGFVNNLSFPADCDIRGSELLVPDLHARVSILDDKNEVIVHLGDDPDWTKQVLQKKLRGRPETWQAGKFIHPHDACFDPQGNIFVVEWVPIGRVSFLRRVS